jgi:hypothetical protein
LTRPVFTHHYLRPIFHFTVRCSLYHYAP